MSRELRRVVSRAARAAVVGPCVALCLFCLAGPLAAAANEPPVHGWQDRLGKAESELRRLPASDTAAKDRVAQELAELRQDVQAWLATYPPANEGQAWLEPAPAGSSVEDLATEVGRLRAAISRVAGALDQGGSEGAFYLGRVDVAVTAAVKTTPTTEVTPAGVSVVGAKEIEAHGRTVLSTALSLAPGVSFTRVGQRNETTVYVRGFDMRQVPLFIDGVPVYTPYDGYADLERFTTFDMAELRVSKGFTSVLYGPNALGGAINVISRRPAERLQGIFGASLASGPMRDVYLNAGTRVNQWYVQGSASYLKADTFPLPGDFVATKIQPTGDRVNAYKRDGKFDVKLGWTPNGTDEYAISYVGQRGRKGNPPYAGTDANVKPRYWKWPNWDKDSLYFVSNTHLGSSAYVRGRAYYDTYANTLFGYDDISYTTQLKPSAFQSYYHEKAIGGSVEFGTSIGSRQMLRAAGHFKKDIHHDHNLGEPDKDFEGHIMSAGIEDTVTLSSKLSLVAGIGADRQTTVTALDYQKAHTIDLLASCDTAGTGCGRTGGVNPQAGLFYAAPGGTMRATISRKTRMPSLKDRYSYKFGTAVPNPDLKAEHSLTTEVGYQAAIGPKTTFDASLFYSHINDLIQQFPVSAGVTQLRNIGEVSHRGVELDVRTRVLPLLDLGADYTYLHRRSISSPATRLVETPVHKGTVSAIVTPIAPLRVVLDAGYEKGRWTLNEGGDYRSVPGYVTANLRGTWTIHRQLDAELGVLNMFDKYYWVVDGYPESGRTVAFTLRYRF